MGLLALFGHRERESTGVPSIAPEPDVWKRYEGCLYVADLKGRYDEIAKKLSRSDRVVIVELDVERKCAWFRTNGGWTIAKVAVHGECGGAYKAIVHTFLSEDERNIFRRFLKLSIVEIFDPDQ